MESTNTGKRKKRKTRKCLDEIRKKSRFCNKLSDTQHNEDFQKNNRREFNVATSKKHNAQIDFTRKITNKRLTLKPTFLSKTIRSETITRPMLSPVKLAKTNTHDKYQWDNVLMHDYLSGGENTAPGDNISRNSNDPSLPGSIIEDNIENRTPQKSFALFSPEKVVGIPADKNMVSNHSSAPTALSVSSTTSSGDSYRLYAEFVEEIPMYLRQNAPSLVQKNIMDKTKMLLQRIYMEGCHQESDENVLKCISNGNGNDVHSNKTVSMWTDSIVDDPITYMRMSRSEMGVDSPSFNTRRPHSASSDESSPTLSFIRDTPDYKYYPRKLNQ